MKTTEPVSIAFDDVGDGEPALLFLPGWCANRTVFRSLLEPAARHRRVLALDWRGHGGSVRTAADFGLEDLVDDAVAVIGAAGLRSVVPVALSHAGWVAIELRRRLGPDVVPAMVLLDWMVLGPPPSFLDALAGLQDPERWEAVRAGLFAMWTTGLDIPALATHIDEMAAYGFDMWARAAREIAASFAAHKTPLAALDALACPTLHVYAQPSDDDVLAAQLEASRARPWFHVYRLAASSHFPMFEVPEELVRAIEGFVAAATGA